VRGELLYRSFDLISKLVTSDKRYEVQRLVQRFSRQLAHPSPTPPFARAFFRLNRLLDGDGYGSLDFAFAATATRPFRRHVEPAFYRLPGDIALFALCFFD
jgi:hypothetical protein